MVEYYSKNNVYYKKYKSGKIIRISKLEYNKKSILEYNKKSILEGGGGEFLK
jgi:hypothetical protein